MKWNQSVSHSIWQHKGVLWEPIAEHLSEHFHFLQCKSKDFTIEKQSKEEECIVCLILWFFRPAPPAHTTAAARLGHASSFLHT